MNTDAITLYIEPTSKTWLEFYPEPIAIPSSKIKWKLKDTSTLLPSRYSSVAYGNNIFVTVGPSYDDTDPLILASSINGNTWTERNASDPVSWERVIFADDIFVAVASNEPNNFSCSMVSTDGINWTSSNTAIVDSWARIAYGNNTFVATSWNGNVMTSSNGFDWALTTPPDISNGWYDITYGNNLFVVIGDPSYGTGTMTSPDGVNWTAGALPNTSSWENICYGDGVFVGLSTTGTNNSLMTSTNGIDWILHTSKVEDNYWTNICFADGQFVAVSSTGIHKSMYSINGVDWTPVSTPSDPYRWWSVTYGNGTFVAVGDNNGKCAIMTS